jgi:2-C-methyl-D-erythritol 2,4-cyclodiphosphate synthase
MRVGIGWDIHRLEDGCCLVVGGVVVSSEKRAIAHSDGDVLTHAIIDALLGAAVLGDIGSFYPEVEENKDMRSVDALKEIVKLIRKLDFKVVNIDSTVILSGLRLAPFRDQIKGTLESIFGCEVSIKFKSGNGVGEVGRGEAIEAIAVVLLSEGIEKNSD